jgi:hypothetical protein
MVKKNSVTKKTTSPVEKKDTFVFKDPSESLWGKIIIGIIIFGTIALILIGAVIAVINFFS